MSLGKALNADSVAIVGASKSETKRGFQAIQVLIDEKYGGRIYPVNPKEKSILGLKCYPTVSAIEGPVDMALLTQSGNMALTLITEAKLKSRKGFSYYVGVGNMDLNPVIVHEKGLSIADARIILR